jgi:hypothetical protein
MLSDSEIIFLPLWTLDVNNLHFCKFAFFGDCFAFPGVLDSNKASFFTFNNEFDRNCTEIK